MSLIPALQLDGNEIIPFAKDNANGSMLVSLLKAFITDGYATTSALNGKQNKLTPGYGIEITPENEIRTKLDVSPFEVVDEPSDIRHPTSRIKSIAYQTRMVKSVRMNISSIYGSATIGKP